jgi:RNA polymerase sigma-70 factor, ECF subfamily
MAAAHSIAIHLTQSHFRTRCRMHVPIIVGSWSSKHADKPDSVLMELISSDDEAALNAIVERHRPPLTAYATGIVRAVDIAEDIVQETFVRLWEHRKRWTPGGSVQAYLYRTARNLVLGRARSLEVQRRTEPEVRAAMHSIPISPLDDAARDELRTALGQALEKLPPRRREALILVRIQGLSLAEAAEKMGLSRQTVANHISLALDDLEIALKDFCD